LAVALPEAVGKCIKVLIKESLSGHPHCPLDPFVLEAGFPSWPLLPIFLLDPDPLDWRRHLPIVAPPPVQVLEVGLQVLSVLLGRHLVHPRGTALTGLTRGFPQTLTVDPVKPVVEHHRRRALRLLGNALEFPGDGWCSRRISQRAFQKNVRLSGNFRSAQLPDFPSKQGVS